MQRVAIERRTSKRTGADDEIALGGDGDAHLRPKLEWGAGLAFAEAVGRAGPNF